jgi:hypothetical protein
VTRIRRRGQEVVLTFSAVERRVLGDAARDLAELLGTAGEQRDADPALQRLLPDGYRDDAEAAGEFATWSRPDLTTAKIATAEQIAAAVDAGDDVRLDRQGVTVWMRGLTDLRVTLAERLGIRTDDDAVPDTQAGALYWWLGETQEMLVATVDRWDAEGRR